MMGLCVNSECVPRTRQSNGKDVLSVAKPTEKERISMIELNDKYITFI